MPEQIRQLRAGDWNNGYSAALERMYPNIVSRSLRIPIVKELADGTLAATISVLLRTDGTAELDELITRPAHEGNGYATELISAAVAGAQALGVTQIDAIVFDAQKSFMEARGFVAVEQRGEGWLMRYDD